MIRRTATCIGLIVAMGLTVGCAKTTVQGPEGKKLTLMKPADQTVKRGDTNGILVTITRTGFRDPVSIKFEDLPKGVKVEDKDLKIGAEDNTATITLRADDTADLVANHVAKIVVTGPDNMTAKESFKLTIKDKS